MGGGVLLLIVLIVFVGKSFALSTPVASVTISSKNLSYDTRQEGSWQITKSAKWISKGKARITLGFTSTIKPRIQYTDVILVLDTSGSMNENRLGMVKSQTTNLINELIPKGSKVALVTFNDSSSILSDFTTDANLLINNINNLTALGNTNYYQALVNVDNILKNYKSESNRDCVVLFLTDGLPNIDTPNEVSQYKYLKDTYPYLTINGIQYEMGDTPVTDLKNISDNQFVTSTDNLDKFLYRAATSPIGYDELTITDFINTNYFNITDINDISTSYGKVRLVDNKVTWDLTNLKTGIDAEATIDINLNSDLLGKGGIYDTNEKLEVAYKIGSTDTTETSTKTPILADNYRVIYDGNAPDGCSVSNVPSSTKVSVFDTVTVSDEVPACDGYKFKGWKIETENVYKINENHFIMPEADVTIKAEWSKLSLGKAMNGKVSNVQNLYQMMADNSVPDNIKSEFVSSNTGINFSSKSSDTNGKGIYQAVKLEGENTPIYYYRGDVKNNNVIFANKCWKIVRTTETKGIKLIYNGEIQDENGVKSCDNTGADSTIGSSAFNSKYNSLAYNGYMYGDVYSVGAKSTSIAGLGDKTPHSKSSMETTNFKYASSVEYDGETGKYTLVNAENRVWSDTYSIGTIGNQFLYTCFSEDLDTCEEVYYTYTSDSSSEVEYSSFKWGELAEDILNRELVYSNDVTYDEDTNMYTLVDTMKSKIGDLEKDITLIGEKYHYTCLNETGICETVRYINYISSAPERDYGYMWNVKFTGGMKIEEAVKKMTTESAHTVDSIIKTKVDTWYNDNILEYDSKIEDTPYCNDRTIGEYGGWDRNTPLGNLNYQKQVDMYITDSPLLMCRNKNDAYTVSDTINGNGDLTYKTGLLTADEIKYAGGAGDNTSYYLYTGRAWWTISPRSLYVNDAYGFLVYERGRLDNYRMDSSCDVRPVISLVSGTKSVEGDGTVDNPFIVE